MPPAAAVTAAAVTAPAAIAIAETATSCLRRLRALPAGPRGAGPPAVSQLRPNLRDLGSGGGALDWADAGVEVLAAVVLLATSGGGGWVRRVVRRRVAGRGWAR